MSPAGGRGWWSLQGLRGRVALVAAVTGLVGCGDGPATPDGPVPTSLALAVSVSGSGGGDQEAYDRADAVRIRLSEGGAAIVDQVFPFDPSGQQTTVSIELELEDETTLELEAELRSGTAALFAGSTSLTVVPGRTAVADLDLVPVAAGVVVPSSLPTLTSIGETTPLGGAVVFATGDTIRGRAPTWSSQNPGVAVVAQEGGTTVARAVGDGQATLVASSGSFQETVVLGVDLVVTSVEVNPASGVIEVGEDLELTFTARDALGNPLPGRSASWSSRNPVVASVDASGMVSGESVGTTEIVATVEGVSGSATVEVVAPAPEVTTLGAVDVGALGATARGQVNPRGSATTAWFEWGTDPSLAQFSSTPGQDVGAGDQTLSVSAPLSGLEPSTTYYFRVAAENDGGLARGLILNFQTSAIGAPGVTTLDPTGVGTNSATFQGEVDANGLLTSAWFEWDYDPAFSEPQFTNVQEVPATGTNVAYQATVSDLQPETKIYYRAVAQNEGGTAVGETVTFQTDIPPPSGLGGSWDGDVFLSWTDNSFTEASFVVERSTSPGGGFSSVGVNAANDRFFTDPAPFPAGDLYYRVFACDASRCSDPSNVLHVTVPAPSISGTVTYCSATCFGYVGVTVNLNGPVNTSTTSGSFGSFVFSNLPPGSYVVSVEEILCSISFSVSSQSVSGLGWGEFASVSFTGGPYICSPPPPGGVEGAPSSPPRDVDGASALRRAGGAAPGVVR